MKRTNVLYSLIIMAALMISFATSGRAQTKPWVTMYYAGWSQGWSNNGYLPTSEVDFTAMTVVAHMSLSLTSTGTLDSVSNSITPVNSAALISAAHAVGTKVIITIGGWATESRFLSSSSPTYLNTFVTNIVNFVKGRGYDGVDIDWEPITPADTSTFVTLIEALRQALPSPRYLLTSTAGLGEPYTVFAHVQNLLDQINIMTYDLAWNGPGCVTWFNSALHQDGVTYKSTGGSVPACDNIVKNFTDAGVAPGKLGIGSELAGFVWKGGMMIDSAGNPTGNGPTGPDQEWEGYLDQGNSPYVPTITSDVPLYSFYGGPSIMKNYYSPSRYHWDAGADEPYLSIDSAGNAGDCFVSYEDTNAIAAKFQYIRQQHLGGLIVYELGMGYPGNGTFPILESIKRDMNEGTTVTTTDTIPPVVSISAPANGSTVTGNISILANATDNIGVSSVTFSVDGSKISNPVYAAPYTVTLNTAQLSNGSHTITAMATDASGNGSTASVTVNVLNSTSTSGIASSSALPIYQSGLQSPWLNVSWNATINFANTSPVSSGSSESIQVINKPWGALALHYGNWSTGYVDSTGYIGVQFEVYSGTATTFSLMLQSDAGTSFPNVSCGTLPANQWNTVTVLMSKLNPSGAKFSGIDLMETSGVQKTYYVGNLALTGLTAPKLLSPQNGATTVSTQTAFTWDKCSGASSYRIQVATDTTFSTSSCAADSCDADGDSLTFANLKAGTTYFWHVNASMSSSTSQWSPTWSFTTKSDSSSSNLLVYQDSLNSPWINASWSASVNFNCASQIYSGSTAIEVNQQPWGSLSLNYGNWNSLSISSTLYSAIQFDVYSTSATKFSMLLQNSQNTTFSSVSYGKIAPSTWTVVTIPLSELDPSNVDFNRIDILETSGVQRTYYVDNIQLIAKLAPSKSIAKGAEGHQIPTKLTLQQNYPNPFNPSTTIAFSMPSAGHVSLKIYDILGQEVARLLDGYATAGIHEVNWNAGDLASGVYIYRLQTKSATLAKKMILMK